MGYSVVVASESLQGLECEVESDFVTRRYSSRSCVYVVVFFLLGHHSTIRTQASVLGSAAFGREYLVRNTDDTASRTGTSVTSLLGLLVSALAEVVGAGVDDDGALLQVSIVLRHRRAAEETYANDALGADKLDQLVLNASLSVTLGVGLEVTKVTNVALLVAGGTVGLVLGVDCC